jgi:hypothetical protein
VYVEDSHLDKNITTSKVRLIDRRVSGNQILRRRSSKTSFGFRKYIEKITGKTWGIQDRKKDESKKASLPFDINIFEITALLCL